MLIATVQSAGLRLKSACRPLSMGRCHARWIVLGGTVAAMMIVLQLGLPLAMKRLFDTLTGARAASLQVAILVLAAVAVGTAGFEASKNCIFKNLGERMLADIRDQ